MVTRRFLSCVVEVGREVPASTLGINAPGPKKRTSSQVGAQVVTNQFIQYPVAWRRLQVNGSHFLSVASVRPAMLIAAVAAIETEKPHCTLFIPLISSTRRPTQD